MPLLLLLLFQHAASSPPEPQQSSWNNFRPAVNQQSLQTVLISIEERLRALDTLYSPRYTPRWEISIEQQSRRMETIESRLGRLETLLELRLDKLSETLSARQLKEELSKDQMNRKLDSTYERLNHRLGYLEARLDVGIAKLQSTIEAGVGRIERLETTAVGRQNDKDAELADIGTRIDDIKKQLFIYEERQNSSLATLVENGKHMAVEMDNLTTMIEDLHTEFNKTQAGSELNDGEGTDHQEVMKKNMNILVDKVTNGIDRHANNFITKANNMYNDMWRRTQLLEGLVKDSMSLSNATRRELQEGIRSIAIQIGRRGLLQPDRERQEGTMDIALDTLGLVQRRLNELGRKFDSSFQMLMLAQNLFLESCHRIQLDEPQLETKLTKVLERILDDITNRGINTDRELQILQELLKSHSSHITRAIGHTTNTVLQVSEQDNEDNKHLQLAILGVKEQLLESNKYIEEAIADIREEKVAATERLDNIVVSLQELQDSVTDIAAKQDADKEDLSDCPDSEQIATEILEELQRKGLIFTQSTTFKHVNENETEFTITSRENDNEKDDDLFGEDTIEEDETNTDDEEMESLQTKKLRSTENVSEEIFDEEEPLEETEVNTSSITNTNLTLNSSFQRQHRFDVQTNKNSTKDTGDTFNPAQVTIQIIPHSINIESRINENQLLGLDLHNVAAIIQNSDSISKKDVQKPILTIVHAIKTNNNKTDLLERNTAGNVDIVKNLQPNVHTIQEELNYINGTFAYNHTNASGLEENNNLNVSRNLSRNSEEIDYSTTVEINKPQAEIEIHINKNNNLHNVPENGRQNIDTNYNSNESHKMMNNSENHKSDGTISVSNITNLESRNITQNDSIESEIKSVVQVPPLLKKLMDLYNTENQNLTATDFWRHLMARKLYDKGAENATLSENYFNIKQNKNESHNGENYEDTESRSKSNQSAMFSIDIDGLKNLINVLNDTTDGNYDIQKQRYFNRLQELATELVNRNDDSDLKRTETLKSTDTTDEISRVISNEEN